MGYSWQVSQETVQVIEIALLSCAFLILVLLLSRRRMLSFRYTIGWLAVFGISGTAGLLVPLAEPIADVLRISTPMVFVGLIAIVLLLITVQLSISISGLQREIQNLTETIALLENRLENHVHE